MLPPVPAPQSKITIGMLSPILPINSPITEDEAKERLSIASQLYVKQTISLATFMEMTDFTNPKVIASIVNARPVTSSSCSSSSPSISSSSPRCPSTSSGYPCGTPGCVCQGNVIFSGAVSIPDMNSFANEFAAVFGGATPLAEKKTCPECRGTKVYVGLRKIEPCTRCNATGEI